MGHRNMGVTMSQYKASVNGKNIKEVENWKCRKCRTAEKQAEVGIEEAEGAEIQAEVGIEEEQGAERKEKNKKYRGNVIVVCINNIQYVTRLLFLLF